MFHLIPAPLHRATLRLVYALRRRLRHLTKPDLAGVAVLLTDAEDRCLLVRHTYGPQGWAIPGGGMRKGEDPANAARREIREELGCEIEDLSCRLVVKEELSRSPHTAHVYTARPIGTPRADLREIADLRWFSKAELGAAHLTRLTALRLEELGFHNSES